MIDFPRRLAGLLALALWVLATPVLAQAPKAPPAPAPAGTPQAAPPAAAQAPAPAPIAEMVEVNAEIKALLSGLERTDKGINDAREREEELGRLRGEVEQLLSESLRIAENLRPRLADTKSQIEKLGPPPKDAPEPESVAQERARLNTLAGALDGAIKTTEFGWVRARQQIERITDLRHSLFTKGLLQRLPSPLVPSLWRDAVHDAPTVWGLVSYLAYDWWASAGLHAGSVIFLTAGGILLFVGMRHALLKMVASRRRRDQDHPPTFFERAASITWVAPMRAVPGIFAALLVYGGLDALNLLYFPSDRLMASALKAIVIYAAVSAIIMSVLAPREPDWRLVGIDDVNARRIAVYLRLICAVFALDIAIGEANKWLLIPLSVSVVQTIAANLTVVALVAAMVLTTVPATAGTQPLISSARLRPMWIKLPLIVTAGAIVAATMTGYVALGRFIAQQLVTTGIVVVTSWLVYLAIRTFTREPSEAGLPVGELLENTFGLDAPKRQTLAKLTEFALTLMLVAVAVPFVLLQWGFAAADIRDWFKSVFFGFEVGQFRISLARILLGIALFIALVLATRLFQRWLKDNVLRPSNLDTGIQHSVETVVGYAGTVLAVLLAVSYAGFDITNFAIVAGALSVGIGFGLQSIVNNFVSGLILLIERPVKVGDWIVVGGDEGYVRKISVRSTEIETFDRSSVILPNADLITGRVKNWTLRDAVGRLKITINVSLDADFEEVKALLLKIAAANRGVLQYPKPFVVIEGFFDHAATVSLNVFVGDVNLGGSVRTDLAIAMLKTLRAAKIKIPNPEPPAPAAPEPAQPEGAQSFQLAMTVGYDADPERARDVLLDVARKRTPAHADMPKVVFDGFGEGGIRLMLWAAAPPGQNAEELRTAVAFAAIKALRDAGVPNAAPQHQVKLSDVEPLRRALGGGERAGVRGRTPEESVG